MYLVHICVANTLCIGLSCTKTHVRVSATEIGQEQLATRRLYEDNGFVHQSLISISRHIIILFGFIYFSFNKCDCFCSHHFPSYSFHHKCWIGWWDWSNFLPGASHTNSCLICTGFDTGFYKNVENLLYVEQSEKRCRLIKTTVKLPPLEYSSLCCVR